MRRAALEEIGGFAAETVTEDAHTLAAACSARLGTAYLRLPLAAGLATERLALHVGQRMRWARGMIQILRMDNPLFGRGLNIGQRICYFTASLHFLFALPRLVFLTAPLAFLFFGQNIIAASPLAIIAYAGAAHVPHRGDQVAPQRPQPAFVLERDLRGDAGACPGAGHAGDAVDPTQGKFNVTDKGGIAGATAISTCASSGRR